MSDQAESLFTTKTLIILGIKKETTFEKLEKIVPIS